MDTEQTKVPETAPQIESTEMLEFLEGLKRPTLPPQRRGGFQWKVSFAQVDSAALLVEKAEQADVSRSDVLR